MPTAHISEIIKVHPPKLRTIRTGDVRFLRGLWHKLKGLKPAETVIDIVGPRDVRLVNAWLQNGAPADLMVDKAAMNEAPQGQCLRVDLKAKRMEPVESPDAPGYYLEIQGDEDQ